MSPIVDPFGPSRCPRLDRHPRVQLAVVEGDVAAVVDDDAGVVWVAVRVVLHQREAAPDRVGAAGIGERGNLGAIEAAHDRRVGAHRQAVQRVLGKHDEVHRRQVPARLSDEIAYPSGLRRELVGRIDDGVLELHQPEDHTR
jgi:hypothetical protein